MDIQQRHKADHPFASHLACYSPATQADSFLPRPRCPSCRCAHQQDSLAFMGCAPSLCNILRTNLQARSARRVAVLIYCRAAVVGFCLQDQRKAYSNKPALLRKLESARSGIKLTTSRPELGRRPAASLQPELQAVLCCPQDRSKAAFKVRTSLPTLLSALPVPSNAFGPLQG